MRPRFLTSLLISVALVQLTADLHAQVEWQQTNGPVSSVLSSLFISNQNTLFAETTDGLYVKRANTGWTHVSKQGDQMFLLSIFAQSATGILFGKYEERDSVQRFGLAISTDDGRTWTSTGLVNILGVNAQFPPFYAWGGRLYQSLDDAASWQALDRPHAGSLGFRSSKNTFFQFGQEQHIVEYDSHGNVVGVHTEPGYTKRSQDTGKTWDGGFRGNCTLMFEQDQRLYAYAPGQCYMSTNDGLVWTAQYSTSMPIITRGPSGKLYGPHGGSDTISASSDFGRTWKPVGVLGLRQSVAVAVDQTEQVWVVLDTGLASIQNGTTQFEYPPFVAADAWWLQTGSDGVIYAMAQEGSWPPLRKIWYTTDHDNWVQLRTPFTISRFAPSVADYIVVLDDSGRCYSTKDRGARWNTMPFAVYTATVPSNGTMFASDTTAVYQSNDGGEQWIFRSVVQRRIGDMAVRDGIVYVSVSYAVPSYPLHVEFIESADQGRTWRPSDGAGFAVARDGDSLTLRFIVPYAGCWVVRTADSGRHWRQVGYIADSSARVFGSDHSTNRSIHVSLNGGQTWSSAARGLPWAQILDIASGPQGEEYAAIPAHGVWRTKITDSVQRADQGNDSNAPLQVTLKNDRKYVVLPPMADSAFKVLLYDERGVLVRVLSDGVTSHSVRTVPLPSDLRGAFWVELISTSQRAVAPVALP